MIGFHDVSEPALRSLLAVGIKRGERGDDAADFYWWLADRAMAEIFVRQGEELPADAYALRPMPLLGPEALATVHKEIENMVSAGFLRTAGAETVETWHLVRRECDDVLASLQVELATRETSGMEH